MKCSGPLEKGPVNYHLDYKLMDLFPCLVNMSSGCGEQQLMTQIFRDVESVARAE